MHPCPAPANRFMSESLLFPSRNRQVSGTGLGDPKGEVPKSQGQTSNGEGRCVHGGASMLISTPLSARQEGRDQAVNACGGSTKPKGTWQATGGGSIGRASRQAKVACKTSKPACAPHLKRSAALMAPQGEAGLVASLFAWLLFTWWFFACFVSPRRKRGQEAVNK